jgi:hypothetical protein
VLVAHTCNSSYSGGRDQESNSLKPARANSPQKRARVAQGEGPEFKPQHCKKKKKKWMLVGILSYQLIINFLIYEMGQ